jgi:hypothetical protein
MVSTSAEINRHSPDIEAAAFERFCGHISTFAPDVSSWFQGIESCNQEDGRLIREQLASIGISSSGDFGDVLRSLIPKLREAFKGENGWAAGNARIGQFFQVVLFSSEAEYGCRVLWCNFTQEDGSQVIGHGLTIRWGNLMSAKQLKDEPVNLECLQTTDGATPYRSIAEVQKQLVPFLSRCVALALPVDRGGFFNSIAVTEGRDYNVLEIAGSSFQDKLTKVAEYLSKDREGRKASVASGEFRYRPADIELEGQFIPAERKALYQQMTGKSLGPFYENIRDLLSNPQEARTWSAFQSVANPESNGAPAYLLIGQKEVKIAHFSEPSIWGDVSYGPRKAVYEMRGTYLPTSDDFLETVESIDHDLTLDDLGWIPVRFDHNS